MQLATVMISDPWLTKRVTWTPEIANVRIILADGVVANAVTDIISSRAVHVSIRHLRQAESFPLRAREKVVTYTGYP